MGSSLTRAPLAAVLWDLDGTLIDTSSSSFVALLEILQELCQKHKIVSEITREQLLPLIASDTVGGDGKDGKVADGDGVKKKDKEGWAAEALALTGLDKKGVKPKALVDKWESAMITRRAQIPLLPGSIELVRHFKKAGIPQAIATMSSSRSVHVKRSNQIDKRRVLKSVFQRDTLTISAALCSHRRPYVYGSHMCVAKEELFSLMDCVICGDDKEVKNRKPAPDIYIIAAQRLNVNVTKCVVIEDSPEGMRAGASAGAKVVGVPAAWTKEKNIGRGVKVDFLVSSLWDFPCTKFSGLTALKKPTK